MDTDNCSKEVRENFINKSMFKGHWLYDYIVPIYNIEKLEDVLEKAGIKYAKTKTEKGNYVKIFPKDHKKIIANQDIKDIEEFEQKLEKVNNTNMDSFIKYCLEIEKECNHLK